MRGTVGKQQDATLAVAHSSYMIFYNEHKHRRPCSQFSRTHSWNQRNEMGALFQLVQQNAAVESHKNTEAILF